MLTTQMVMASRALLILLLCVLLLQAQGNFPTRRKLYREPHDWKINFTFATRLLKRCERHVSTHLCRYHCQYDEECQANNVCCLTFCGTVCMNIL